MNIKDILLVKGITEDQLRTLVEKKKSELSISEEEALKLVGAEMGILQQKEIKVKDAQLGLKHITLRGNIEKILDIKVGKNYKMRKLIIADETGKIPVILWNEGAIKASNNMVEGDEVQIINGYTKKNNRNGVVEIHVGKEGTIMPSQRVRKVMIANMQDGYNLVEGFIVRAISYGAIRRCAICKTRIEEKCPKHGTIAIESHILAKIVIDDGTKSIRVAAFDRIAQKLLELSNAEDNTGKLEDLANNLLEIKAYILKKGEKYKLKRIYPLNFNS
jgi:ssDNA-binding replication factor A large subunit